MNADPLSSFALGNPTKWALECEHIERMAERPIRDRAAFIAYCALQRDLAAQYGFTNARVRIQSTINILQRAIVLSGLLV